MAKSSGGKLPNHVVDTMAARGVRDITDDVFSEFHDADYNHPTKTQPVLATHVGLDDDDAIYIYVPNEHNMPPNKHMQYVERVREGFEIAFPERTIIAGPSDLKFTTIGRKQMFKGKLDGTL